MVGNSSRGPREGRLDDWYGRRVNANLIINGEAFDLAVAPTTRLVDVLRDDLGLTGTKNACSRGDCGACTVLVGNRAVLACLTLAARVTDEIRTVEGISKETEALRQSFADHGGLQCGYCTPGLIVRGSQLLADATSDRSVRAELAGNFCRCTGYNGVVSALLHAQGLS